MRTIQVGVDATSWQNTRGYGRYARALLKGLLEQENTTRYTLVVDDQNSYDVPPGTEIKRVPCRQMAARAAASNGSRSLMDMFRMSRALSDPLFDAVLYPSIYTYVPVLSRAKKIVVVHDVIAETFPGLTAPNWRSRLFWNTKVAAGLRQASVLITVSEYSKRGIVKMFGVSPEQVFVVSEASDAVFRRLENPLLSPVLRAKAVPESKPLVVYVGGFGPHKNVSALINAIGTLAGEPAFDDVVLILVGEHEKEVFYSEAERLRAQIQRLGLTHRVVFTGFLPDEDLVILLNRAAVLVLPSLMEGFGLPAIEAAACGCPVIATRESPLPSILGEGGMFIDPRHPEELSRALRTILYSDEIRTRMSQSGLAAAAKCSWEQSARQMHEIIRSAVQQ